MTLHLIREDLLLRLVTMLEELLHNIVAEDVCHQLQRVWLDLTEDLFLLVTVGSFQLLLNEA